MCECTCGTYVVCGEPACAEGDCPECVEVRERLQEETEVANDDPRRI